MKTKKGFTIIEAVMALIIFSSFMIISYSMISSYHKMQVESNIISYTINIQDTAFDLIKNAIQTDWDDIAKGINECENNDDITFYILEYYNNKYEFKPVSDLHSGITDYEKIKDKSTPFYPYLLGENQAQQERIKWIFEFQNPDELGPYIKKIERDLSNKLTFTFSKNIQEGSSQYVTANTINRDFRLLNNATWGSVSEFNIDNNTIDIEFEPDLIPEDASVKPSEFIIDSRGFSDITKKTGVVIPENPNTSCGAPQVYKVILYLFIDIENDGDYYLYKTFRYINYEN